MTSTPQDAGLAQPKQHIHSTVNEVRGHKGWHCHLLLLLLLLLLLFAVITACHQLRCNRQRGTLKMHHACCSVKEQCSIVSAYQPSWQFAVTGVYVPFHGGCSRAEWSQVGSEVNYNRCRYAVLHKGQVGMYQVGSPTLGQLVGADDIEKAAVGWDVLKIAKLVDLKVSLASYGLPIRTAYLRSVTWLSSCASHMALIMCLSGLLSQGQSRVSLRAVEECLVKVSLMSHHMPIRTA